jgi:death on curing protein
LPTPRFISKAAIFEIHRRQIRAFGGTDGIRDEGLLASALAQPEATFGGEFLHPSLEAQAAAYLFHLAMNHPFLDGNKRTAFAAMATFLKINGYRLNLSEDEAYDLVLQVVEGKINKDSLATFLAQNIQPK